MPSGGNGCSQTTAATGVCTPGHGKSDSILVGSDVVKVFPAKQFPAE